MELQGLRKQAAKMHEFALLNGKYNPFNRNITSEKGNPHAF